MIIDTHVHLGEDVVFEAVSTEAELLEWHQRCQITGAVIQPFIPRPYIEDTRKIHDRIAAFCDASPADYFGMISINPHLRPDEYDREAERCVRELGFVAIKLTPIAHAAHPASQAGRHVFETAAQYNIPIMIHTGLGIPFADPAALFTVAAEYRQVPIILAHAGSDMFAEQALVLASQFDHVYLEPSWLNILNVQKAVKKIGPEKLMFSSDIAINIPVELAKYRTLLSDGALERVLSGTAIEVFQLKDRIGGTQP